MPERPVEAVAAKPAPLSVNLAVAALSAGPEIHQAYSQALKIMPEHLSNTGYDQQGLALLREAIARRYSERGLPTHQNEHTRQGGCVAICLCQIQSLRF